MLCKMNISWILNNTATVWGMKYERYLSNIVIEVYEVAYQHCAANS